MKFVNSKYFIPLLILIYLFQVYGSLILNKFELISDSAWCNIHYVGIATILVMFFLLIKDKLHHFVFSIGIAIFTSRLITELFSDGFEYYFEMYEIEYYFEMISVISITSVIYFIKKK